MVNRCSSGWLTMRGLPHDMHMLQGAGRSAKQSRQRSDIQSARFRMGSKAATTLEPVLRDLLECQRNNFRRLRGRAHCEGDVLLAVDHVGHRHASHLARNSHLAKNGTGLLVVSAD